MLGRIFAALLLGRIFGLLWLLSIFSLGFGAGLLFWDFRDWKSQGHPQAQLVDYLSDVFHLSTHQRKLLEKALAAKDRNVERMKGVLKEL